MLKIGDKIKMVQIPEIKNFDYDIKDFMGIMFEIIGINENIIAVQSSSGIGFLSSDEVGTHFIKVRQWTPWIKSGFIEYRTDNEKYVYVRYNGCVAKSSCNLKYDTFNLETGIMIAVSKVGDKIRRNIKCSCK
mgnify:CR=1 FL=1